MVYCRIKSCENFKGVQNSRVHMFSLPRNLTARDAWFKAIGDQECGSSPLICIDHFTSDDYIVYKNGTRIELKSGAVPSIFNVVLSDYEEGTISDNEVIRDEFDIKEMKEIESKNKKLQQEIEELKRFVESEKIFTTSCITHYKEIKQKQTKEIKELKRQVAQMKLSVDQLTKERDSMFGSLNAKQKQIVQSIVHKQKGGEKYPETFRQFCFTMHYHSPRAYEFLRETFSNHLPHAGTIRAWYANSDLNTEPNVISVNCLNMIRRKSSEKAEKGEKLICGVLFDEVHLRKHIGWSNRERKLVGYSIGHEDENECDDAATKSDVASQALVFIVAAVNDSFEIPIAYYFISSMNGERKKTLVEKIIEELMDCNVIVSHVTFDGFQANKKMCRLLGATLNVYSPFFKPYIRVRNQNIYIFFDICHMIKLIRNRLSAKEVLFDCNGKEIRWEYFVDLVRMNDRGFALTHKMNQSHIEWRSKKMKVNIAVQTLSGSTADSMELLMNHGVAEFHGAEFTIKFVRIVNSIFDVFNTKHDQNENPFKRALSRANATQIFELFEKAIPYIKGLKVLNAEHKTIRVCNSRINTGFNGFIINMVSLKLLFQEYVEERLLVKMLRTFCFQQDPVEIFFGKIRSLNGFNDNPTCEQFSAAYRKLLAYNTIMYSKFSNCSPAEHDSNPYTNILTISSKRSTTKNFNASDCVNVTEEQIEQLYDKLRKIEEAEEQEQHEDLSDYTVAHIASFIEGRIKLTKQFGCMLCKRIFDENTKKAEDVNLKSVAVPCHSTFHICKQTERFIKIDLMKGDIDFSVVYHEILQNLNFDLLYDGTDFSDHSDHKVFLIRYVVDEFVRIRATHMARTLTLNEHKKSLRVKLHKLLHYLGQ